MNPTEKLTRASEVQCRLANERFGLQQALRIIVSGNFNCNDVAVEHIINLSSDRKLDELKEYMLHIGVNGSDKPRHTRIRTPSSVNGLY